MWVMAWMSACPTSISFSLMEYQVTPPAALPPKSSQPGSISPAARRQQRLEARFGTQRVEIRVYLERS